MIPDNVWTIGITQEPSTGGYYLVFYHEIHQILDQIIHCYDYYEYVKYMQYGEFYKLKEIGSGSYRTVYTAKYQNGSGAVVLKRFKNFDQMPELFINEVIVSNV